MGKIGADHKNYKLTPQQREEVVRRYMLGEKLVPLEKEFGVTKESIRILAKNRGMVTDRRNISADYIQEYRRISDDLCKGTIIPNIVPVAKHRTHHSTKYSLDEDAFSIITPESAYWIGFLMADGGVVGNAISLQLSNSDKYHIEKFKIFMKSSHKVSVISHGINSQGMTRNEAYKITFHSNKICSDVFKFGITERKSLTAKVTYLDKNRHFWRGMIDGDGTIYSRKVDNHMMIYLIGSKDIAHQFYEFIKIFRPYLYSKPRLQKKNGNSWDIRVAGKDAAVIMDILYHNAPIALPRKSKHALELVEIFMKTHGKH